MNCPSDTRGCEDFASLEVTFEQRNSGRRWTAEFRLGTESENSMAALDVAWKHNAAIVGSRALP